MTTTDLDTTQLGDLLPLNDAMRVLGIGRSTLHRWRRSGKLPACSSDVR